MVVHNISEFPRNLWFFCAFFSWCLAQCIKMLLAYLKTRRVRLHYLVSTGGMPSAHSATVSGLATSLGITEGFASPIFAIAAVYAIITMFDASTVRRATGQQAAVLNEIIRELFTQHRLKQERLKELLGHTRIEVLMGMFTGIAFSAAATSIWISKINQ